jgi:hypothetical protein
MLAAFSTPPSRCPRKKPLRIELHRVGPQWCTRSSDRTTHRGHILGSWLQRETAKTGAAHVEVGVIHSTRGELALTEIMVRDIRRSVECYRDLGFAVLRDGGDFVELTWEDHRLHLAEISARLARHAQ